MSILVNLKTIGLNERDWEVITSYLYIDPHANHELIKKMIILEKYIKNGEKRT